MHLALLPFLAQASCPELTGLQKFAGFVSWMNILRVFAIAGGVVCIGFLLFRWFGWLIEIFALIPVQVYETVGYAASIALVVWGHSVSETNRMWPVLGGSLLFGAMVAISAQIHLKNRINPPIAQLYGLLFVAWGAIALYYNMPAIGFIAVGALMGALGFSGAVIPMGYAIGFKDNDSLCRATSAAFAILAAYVGLKVSNTSLPIKVFESGAFWIGSFVGYLGLLIASSRWYGNQRSYPIMQVVTIVLGMAAIGAGSVFGISQLLGVGGTFFVLYLIEKPFEIPNASATEYAVIGLFVCACLGGGVWWAQNHMDLIRPFLLF
ncbi:MAG: hypothetical protein JWN50_45 [Parcubacteria group bacterium]|nr:hypothetical protein [Parcubacteria group bacterium]